MVEHEFGIAHAVAVEQRGGPDAVVKAAKLYYGEGQVIKAMQILLDNINIPAASTLVRDYFSGIFWRNMSFGVRHWSDALGVPIHEARRLAKELMHLAQSEDDINTVTIQLSSCFLFMISPWV